VVAVSFDRATRQNVFARRVNVDVASHHAMMDPILPELKDALADLIPGFPVIPVISTVENADDPQFDADHWVANLRNPVRFSDAIAAAGANHCTFIEISPHPLLTKAITDTLEYPELGNAHHHSLPTLLRDAHDTVSFHTALNATFTAAPPIGAHPPEPHPALPATPWRHTRHWLEFAPATGVADTRRPAPADGDSPVPVDWLYEPIWRVRPLPDHPGGRAETADSWTVVGDRALAAELGSAPIGAADNVLLAPDADGSAIDIDKAYALFGHARRIATELISLPSPPKLFFLTRNAQPVAGGDRANPVQAVLWGLGRTLALEHPEIWGGVVDVDESMPAVLAARLLRIEAAAGDGEDQVVYRSGSRHVPRLTPATMPSSDSRLGADSCQLVIGATGHIGPSLIRQLAAMGAGTIVALSRSPGEKLKDLTAQLASSGTTVIPVAADAADPEAMAALFERFGADLPPLEGIYLAAFAGGPVTLAEMTDDDVATMFAPKLDALAVLHDLSLRTDVRQFVLFSSISGLLGSRWLAHYTATSTFLDTFAYARRNLGLPATVVNWGLWKSLADMQSDAGEVMANAGLEPMPDDIAIRALSLVMSPTAPVRTAVVHADWPLLAAAYRTRGSLRIVDEVLAVEEAATRDGGASEFVKQLADCPAERQREMLAEHIATLASAVIGLSAGDVLDQEAGFFQLGMDSLMSVTLQRRLSASLGIPLPAALIYEHPTISSLTEVLCERLGVAKVADQPLPARSGLASRAQHRAAARQRAQAGRAKGPGA
jgi:phthiocerol/phenolphthiocerol synthesis type-I polyketide synthase B